MLYLYKNNFINGIPYDQAVKELSAKNNKLQKKIDKFWDSFNVSIEMNNRGLNGKQKILSVIADNFLYRELQDNLKVIFIIMCNSRLYRN
jgi:hypothetical protein